MYYEIPFAGHENIRSTHRNTIEITTDASLTTRGDCIVGVSAASGCRQLPDDLKKSLMDSRTKLRITIRAGGSSFVMYARGDDRLTLTHEHDIVIRKSRFVCPRTLAVSCSAASDEIPRKMIRSLQDGEASGSMTIECP